jgi:hypothetical protein
VPSPHHLRSGAFTLRRDPKLERTPARAGHEARRRGRHPFGQGRRWDSLRRFAGSRGGPKGSEGRPHDESLLRLLLSSPAREEREQIETEADKHVASDAARRFGLPFRRPGTSDKPATGRRLLSFLFALYRAGSATDVAVAPTARAPTSRYGSPGSVTSSGWIREASCATPSATRGLNATFDYSEGRRLLALLGGASSNLGIRPAHFGGRTAGIGHRERYPDPTRSRLRGADSGETGRWRH